MATQELTGGATEDAATTIVTPNLAPTLTPDVALASDEVARSRLFLQLSACIAGAVGIFVMFLDGSLAVRLGVVACCAAAIAGSLAFRRALRDDDLSTQRRWVALCVLLVASSAIAVWFFGVFSPAPMIGTFGIYFLCLGRSMRVALWAYLGGAVAHFVPSVLFALDVLPDPGLFHPVSSPRDMLMAAAMVQVIYAATFALARGSRESTRGAVEKLHEAMVQVRQREALLAEANLALDQAQQAGQRGPYSDRKLGDWLVGDVIGRGAMGDVYEARRDGGERAAVKILHRTLVTDVAHRKRFAREARIVARMRSEHAVRLMDFGHLEAENVSPHEPPYIAMELLEGHDLAWHLRHARTLELGAVGEMVEQVSEALAEAAEGGIVHRDLKPQNLFLSTPRGGAATWKVLDFGISKLVSEASGTVTQGATIGTPAYMAPEQARGEAIDPRADVFSLACIAYRALTGRPAFTGSGLPQIFFEVCFAQPARPGSFAPMPTDIERVLALGLAKSAAERAESARAFAAAFRAGAHGALPAPLRARADALLASAPWGSRK
jgi:tRNA A-37 threonylcarbamoyl transferase component Bud32